MQTLFGPLLLSKLLSRAIIGLAQLNLQQNQGHTNLASGYPELVDFFGFSLGGKTARGDCVCDSEFDSRVWTKRYRVF